MFFYYPKACSCHFLAVLSEESLTQAFFQTLSQPFFEWMTKPAFPV